MEQALALREKSYNSRDERVTAQPETSGRQPPSDTKNRPSKKDIGTNPGLSTQETATAVPE